MGRYRVTHCKRGHEYTAENTGWSKNGQGKYCKICNRMSGLERHNRERYNMTTKEANIARQKPCEICGLIREKMHIDHCHTSNKVRGTLCDNCNHLLGHANDNKEILLKAIKYLDKHNQKPGAEVRPEIYQFM